MDSNIPTRRFEKTAVAGLYLRSNGTYYSRYSLNGRRTWRCLNTDVFTVAKLRHARRTGDIEAARQQGVTINSDLRSLGALARALEAEVNHSPAAESTKRQYRVWIERLRSNWLHNDFETAQARLVSVDTISELRQHLATKARRPQQPERLGYRPAVVNQTLTALRLMLEIAVKHGAIIKNPFSDSGAIRRSIYLPEDTRRPELPSNENMERIFADMGRVHEPERFDETTLKYLQACADNAADHARFLAYSGLRLSEAQALTWSDVKGDTLIVRGTKTDTSYRVVPIIPPLRAHLDHLRTKRISGPILAVKTCIDALQRSCARLNLPALRHHDLRHFFATACIESGVPIPTVSDWLGHADGGALLMRTYRHLRDRHSLEAAKMVTLGAQPAQSTRVSAAVA
jgi:integrase